MELVRAAALGGFVDVVRALGADPIALLRQAGLSRSMLLDTEAMVPAPVAIDLLEQAALATGCETLGLRMAERRSLPDVGRVSLLIAHQATLRDAFTILSRYRNRINSTLILQIENAGEICILREEFSLASPRRCCQSNANSSPADRIRPLNLPLQAARFCHSARAAERLFLYS